MTSDEQLIQQLYHGFNARDIDAVLSRLAENVIWANGMDGGHVHGREAVRAYWMQQWSTIDPHVEPTNIAQEGDSSTVVDVHQVVHDLQGTLLLEETVRHVFRITGGLVSRFDIGSASELSTIAHGT
jgi:ketosteroid isomerase-like protein